MLPRNRRSCFDFDAFPEGDAVFDFGGSGFGLRIIPCGVLVFHAVDFEMVIVRGTLPGAFAGVTAGFQEFFFYIVDWKILVPFDDDRMLAVSDYFSCPGCTRHFGLPLLFFFLTTFP